MSNGKAEKKTPARKKPSGLGRGLSALMGEVEQEASVSAAPDEGAVQMLPVGKIAPHPDQPRRHFDEDALSELANSIEVRGMIQPIVVRPQGAGYQIVAGERRWRAAQRAHLHQVPVIVRDFDDAETLEIALVENIQREDLNAIEEAEAYKRLIEDFGHSQAALARLVHKSRSHVTNLLRLLELPDAVRAMVVSGELDMGHARAIIGAPDVEALARLIAAQGLSVREAEDLARRAKPGGSTQQKRPPRERDADIVALERQLGEAIGLAVAIDYNGKMGTVSVAYRSLDQLDLICQRLSGEKI
ncbi:ParB/RepB/Spo0J family partition protein [Parasphingopyxis lamellibrachiae]|uniref:Chromosome segregation DNA-binding protein n=1 Tax=Parasphingopyxis lamellibrachiae TaxID=680125 RepID=A0A3D9FH21_9SPHN|nr:ParB/RepB/Spo0J family partition protein [Parasphingopyxis lamellibrachiae]RED17083.1 chromosome segregation DNA-binding protein [Parasphingopyxis lamellibrachiae]